MSRGFLLLFGGWLLAAAPAFAQLQEQRHNWAVGVSGGVNMNSVSFEPRIKQAAHLTPTLGVTARFISEKYFRMICGIQAEVNYSVHGWKEKIEDNSGDTYHRQMGYVEVPLLAHLGFGKDGDRGARFVVNLGPQIGFLLNEKEVMSESWDPSQRANGVTQQYGYLADRKFAYGIVAGGGLELMTGIGHFILEARYYYGLSDFYNSTKKDPFSRSAVSSVVGKLTYLIDLKKR